MTSEQNVCASVKYLNSRNDERNSCPKRIPTEGEIDQFIELLKSSNTGNLEDNSKPNFSDYTERNLKSENTVPSKKLNSISKVPSSETSSCVTLKEDGTLMKTIHIQSPESYLKEAERFDPEMHHEREMERDSIRSISPYSQSSDYLRKTTYLNHQSELKVTLSRDQDRSYGYHDRFMDRGMKYIEDSERHYNKDVMHSKPMSSESHSRSYDYPHDRERYSHEFGSSTSFNRYSAGPTQSDVDFRRLPSISPPLNSPRSTYPGEYRHTRGVTPPPPHYSERTNMRLRTSSPYRSSYYEGGGGSHYGGSTHSRDIPHSNSRSQWSRSPSPPRSSRIRHNSRDKQLYSPFNEDSLSDFEMQRFSTDVKPKREDRRYRKRSPSLGGVPSPPSPPPPPVLSNLKKKIKEENYRPDFERTKSKKIDDKDSVNPISTLLADRNVSISTLLEAAIGSSAGGNHSSSYSPWDSSKKAEIVAKCEEKIGQLYRHRVSGPGSFIPDPPSQQVSPYVYKSPLIIKHPRLEFNSRPVGNVWNCPNIVTPDPNSYKYYSVDEKNNEVVCITDDEDETSPFSHSKRSSISKSKKKSNKKKEDDYQRKKDNDIAQKIETRVSYGSNPVASNTDASRASEMEKQGLPIANIFVNDYNKPLQEQQYNAETHYASANAPYNVPPNFQQQPFVTASSSYDSNIWMNSGVGYQQQPSFENQLVQYPIGHQPGPPVGPSVPFGMNNDYPMMPVHYSTPMVQYPIGQDMNRYPNPGLPSDRWFRPDEHNTIKSPVETVQYPLKQRSNNDKGNSNSKSSHSKNSSYHSNLISLTGSTKTQTKERSERNEKSKCLSEFNSEKTDKETSKDDSIPLDLDYNKIEKLKKFSTLIRNIQMNDNKTRDIIKDLESGPKIYSYAYLVWHRMLLKKDQNKYKIYVSELGENTIVNVFHEIFHYLTETELEEIARTVLTVIPNLQEKVAHAFRLCPFCKKGAHNDKNRESARAKSPTIPFREMCSPKRSYFRRSRSPSKKRKSYHKSPPPKKISPKSAGSPGKSRSGRSISKDRSDRPRSKIRSPSPRNLRQSQKRSHSSRSSERRDHRRERSGNRRTPSADRYRRSSRGRSGRSPYSKRITKKSKRSPDVEIVDHIKPKKIDTIDLTEDSMNEAIGKFIVKSEVIDESEIKKEKEPTVQIKVDGSKDDGSSKTKTGEASKTRKISIKFNRNTQPKISSKNNSNQSQVSTESPKSLKQKDDTSSKLKQEKDIQKENKREIILTSEVQRESENLQKQNEKEKCEIKLKDAKREPNENIVKRIEITDQDNKELNLEDKHLVETKEDNKNAKENEDNLKVEENNLSEDNKDFKEKQNSLTHDKENKGEGSNLTEGDRDFKEEEGTIIKGDKNFKEVVGNVIEGGKDIKEEETPTKGDKDQKEEENLLKADAKNVQEEGLKKTSKEEKEESISKIEENNGSKEEGIQTDEESCSQKVNKKQNNKKKNVGKGANDKEKIINSGDKEPTEEGKNFEDNGKGLKKEEIKNLNAEERGVKKNRRISRDEKSREMNEERSLKKDTKEANIENSSVKVGRRNSLEDKANLKEKDSVVKKDVDEIKAEGKEIVPAAKQEEMEEEISQEKEKVDEVKEKEGENNKRNEAAENVSNEKDNHVNDNKLETVKDSEGKEKENSRNQSKEDSTTAKIPNDNEKKEDKESDQTKEAVKVPPQMDFKSRVRHIQLDDAELKEIIDCLENKTEGKNIGVAGYLMKGGMLCKKCQIGNNSEVRIVTSVKQFNSTVFAVHTMSSNHATAAKTIMLFNKHFIPMNNLDKIVETVINECQICK